VAEFEHHVIRQYRTTWLADAGEAGGVRAVFPPFWEGGILDVSNDTGGEAPAEFRGLNFDFTASLAFSRTLSGLRET